MYLMSLEIILGRCFQNGFVLNNIVYIIASIWFSQNVRLSVVEMVHIGLVLPPCSTTLIPILTAALI